MQICKDCKQGKEENDFYKYNYNKNRTRRECKECFKAKTASNRKEYNIKNLVGNGVVFRKLFKEPKGYFRNRRLKELAIKKITKKEKTKKEKKVKQPRPKKIMGFMRLPEATRIEILDFKEKAYTHKEVANKFNINYNTYLSWKNTGQLDSQ